MPEKKAFYIILIVGIIIVVVLALTLGLVFGLKDKDDEKNEDDVEIINSYDNTEELIKKFPVENNVTVQEGLEKKFKIVY